MPPQGGDSDAWVVRFNDGLVGGSCKGNDPHAWCVCGDQSDDGQEVNKVREVGEAIDDTCGSRIPNYVCDLQRCFP
jgi:hypothetical protein